jgi:hypothetical protein
MLLPKMSPPVLFVPEEEWLHVLERKLFRSNSEQLRTLQQSRDEKGMGPRDTLFVHDPQDDLLQAKPNDFGPVVKAIHLAGARGAHIVVTREIGMSWEKDPRKFHRYDSHIPKMNKQMVSAIEKERDRGNNNVVITAKFNRGAMPGEISFPDCLGYSLEGHCEDMNMVPHLNAPALDMFGLIHRAKRLFVVGRGFRAAVKAARYWKKRQYQETGYDPKVFILLDALDAGTLVGENGELQIDPSLFHGEEGFVFLSSASS